MLTISTGHSPDYLLSAVTTGRENYYTAAVTDGEPPGRWWGSGAEAFGLSGEVSEQDMRALYEHFLDPRDERWRDVDAWDDVARLGRRPMRFASVEAAVEAALAAEPDASPERREALRLQAAKASRSPVAYIDATYSVPKSITVLHTAFEAQEVKHRQASASAGEAGDLDAMAREASAADAWRQHREAVERAIWAGNDAALRYLEDHAGYSRVGYHSAAGGRYTDAHSYTAASFFQHTNRDNDPQLHIHNAILNRVVCPDGQVRTLDSRAIHRYRAGAAAVAERVTEEHITRALGLTFATRPDGKAREVEGIPAEVLALFSTRRRAVTAKTADLVARFTRRYDREPTAMELDRLQRQATFLTRPAKSHDGETVEERLDRWDRALREEVAGGLERVAADVLARRQVQPAAVEWSPSQVVAAALADVQTRKAAWNRSDLERAISAALPDHLGVTDPATMRELIEGLAEEATAGGLTVEVTGPEPGQVVPSSWRLADGRSSWQAPAARVWATGEHMAAERALRDATVERGAPTMPADALDRFLAELGEEGIELGADQRAAAAGVLTSGARVEALVGPAGTGKSFTLSVLARAWSRPDLWDDLGDGTAERTYNEEDRRRLFGLATSQIATDVLAAEGLEARNIARWLAAQDRLAEGRPVDGDEALRLRPGDGVVVDESAMASTADVAAIHRRTSEAGAKLILTGDHRQLAAVGAGGAMDLVANRGLSYELADVRRFAAPWERAASLRLRDGDADVLAEYRKMGRVVDGGTVEEAQARAARAWLADHLAGKRTRLVVDTNERAAQVSADVRARLARMGLVEEAGVPLADGTLAGVGDLVQARRIEWRLKGFEGNTRGPINRESYRVTEVLDDGSIRAERPDGTTIALPANYVARDLALDYATTVHSAQGSTVDTSHVVVTNHTQGPAFYVAMTRGREANIAYAATVTVPEDSPIGQVSEAERRDPVGMLAGVVERSELELSAVETEELHFAQARSTMASGARLTAAAEELSAARLADALDDLAASGRITDAQRTAAAADQSTGQLARLLRRVELAGHDPAETLARATEGRGFEGVESVPSVLYRRITVKLGDRLTPTGDTFGDRVPATASPEWDRYLHNLAEEADERARELGQETAAEPPRWALEALGAPSDDPVERLDWEERAGRVAAYRELAEHDDDLTPLGPAPKPSETERHAAWHAAWRALGRPEADREEAELSDGGLLMRVRAYEREEHWAPAWVADELAGTSKAARKAAEDATIFEAYAASQPEAERGQLVSDAELRRAEAVRLAERVTELEAADRTRADWYAHTAATRAAADRARVELVDRGVDVDNPPDATTAVDWLAEHRKAQAAEDRWRRPTDVAEFADVAERRDAAVESVRDVEPVEVPEAVAETQVADVRETEVAEPRHPEEGRDRVADADRTAAAVERAQTALVELRARNEADAARLAEERELQDAGRAAADRQAEQERIAERQSELVDEHGW